MPRSATVAALSFSAPRAALVEMVDRASRVANAKPIDILDSVYLDLRGGDEARWWATDTQIWLGGVVRGLVTQGSGAILLPSSLAKGLLKSCSDGSIALAAEGDRLRVESGTYRGKLPILPSDDFPVVPVLPTGGIDIPLTAFALAIRRVLIALCMDPTKYFIRGALFSGDAIATTDGHRLARARIAGGVEIDTPRVIPAEAVAQLSAMLDHSSAESVRYTWEGRHVFVAGDDVLIVQEIDAKFPDLDRLLDAERTATEMVVDREAWLSALARAQSTALKTETCTSCGFVCDNKGLTLSSQSPDRGESIETIAADVAGKPLTVRLNGRYVQQFLSAMTSEQVLVHASGALSAIGFRPVGGADGAYDYLVMPIRD